jgi:hypothetical protein
LFTVTGIFLENKAAGTQLMGNISFGIKFHGNSVSVNTAGSIKVWLREWNEEYQFSVFLPDLLVKNVILGTKRIVWDGKATISCPQSNLRAEFQYKEEVFL